MTTSFNAKKKQSKIPKNVESQRNMTSPKENNNFPVTNPKEMEIYELPNKEFKMMLSRKFKKLQKYIDRQLTESGK